MSEGDRQVMDSDPLIMLSNRTAAASGELAETHRRAGADMALPASSGRDPEIAEFLAAYGDLVAAARSFVGSLVDVHQYHVVALRDSAAVASAAGAASASAVRDAVA